MSSTPESTNSPAAATESMAATLQSFVRRMATYLQAEKCVFLLHDADSGELVAQSPALAISDEALAGMHAGVDAGISGEVFRSAHPIICHDCAADPRCQADAIAGLHARDCLTVPMVVERRNESQQVVERTTIGVIHVLNKRYGLKFSEEDIRLLTVLGRNAVAVLSSVRSFTTTATESQQLEYTLQSMSYGLLVISRSERIQLMNAAVGQILGLDPAQATKRPYTEVIVQEEIRDLLAHALKQGGDVVKEFTLAERIYQVQTALVRDERGATTGLLCVFNDVTELRNVERMKSDFVSTVSHELRTPLTAIKGFVHTLLDDPDGAFYDQPTRMEFYGIIDSECERLIRLINDLLNVSRIERGLPLHLNYDTVEVAPLLEKCVNFQRAYTEKHRLEVVAPADLPAIVADKDKLDQIITNLVSNAIKYSPDGGAITVSVVDAGDVLRFAVTDSGMGIPPDHLDKVFLRFHRVHSGDSQRVGGTGLGLYLVKNLVELHGGAIAIESTLGTGSTFSFTIPKQPPQA